MSHTAKPYLIGISGGSASGKTFLLNALLEKYSDQHITLISQDNYYKDISEVPKTEDGTINYDHPDALHLDTFAADLRKLCQGESVTLMEYTFNNPELESKEITYRSSPIILVEGLFVFHHPEVERQLDLKIFVDADEHIKLSRRIRRDFVERAWTLEDVLDYYEKLVVPMYRLYIEPYKNDCDLVLPNNSHMNRAVTVLMHHLDKVLEGKN